MRLSATALAYAKSRGLSRSTLAALRVQSGTAGFRSGRREGLFFPHVANGEVVGWKARALGEPKDFLAKKGGRYGLWNLDQMLGHLRESGVVYLTEGEIDACSVVEAGAHPCEVGSAPHGAPDPEGRKEAQETPAGYDWLTEALRAGLSRADKFVLLTDNDGPGRLLRADMVKIIGPARCWFVDWPAGIKDANEFLVAQDAPALLAYIQAQQKPWPVDGLYTLADIPEPPPLVVWDSGFDSWRHKLHFAARTVSVVSGNPGMGKTALMMQVWCQIAERHKLRGAIASFETRAKPHHRRRVREWLHRKPERVLLDSECQEADRWNREHFHWLIHPGRKPSLRWVLDLAEVAVIRHECRFVQIDPWNKLESARPDRMPETEYIGQCLDEVMTFAHDLNCHVQIVAHPSKIDSQHRGRPPYLEDIASSKHWDNKPDHGVIVHRPQIGAEGAERFASEVFVRKARFDELGYPCKLKLWYDPMRAVFVEGEPGQTAETEA